MFGDTLRRWLGCALALSLLLAPRSPLQAATITGTIYDSDGDLFTGTMLFRALRTPLVSGSTLVTGGDYRVGVTNGALSTTLLAGDYRAFIGADQKGFIIAVPSGSSSYSILGLITNAITYTDQAYPWESTPPATASVSGTVKTDTTAGDPVVYLKTSIDALLATNSAPSKLDITNGTAVNLTGTATNLILREVLVPITAYGAVGDGTTDNASAIETALATGYPILIPAGTFRVASEVDVPAGARIYGTGQDSIIKTTSTSISAFKIYDVDDVVIADVSFRGASNNAAASSSAGNAIYITQGSTQVRVNACDIRYFNTGVFANVGSSDIVIDGCTFVGNARAAVNTDAATYVRVLHPFISGIRTGIGDGLLGQIGAWFQKDSQFCQIIAPSISDLRAEAVNVKGNFVGVISPNITRTYNGVIFETDSADVTGSNNGSYNWLIGGQATNITGVGAFAGNTIGVNNAVVHHITIRGYTVIGADYGLTFAGLNSSATNERPYALTVDGNTVEGTRVGPALSINANDSVFTGNTLRGAYTDAVQVYRGTNNLIADNLIYGPRNNGIYLFTAGLNNVVRDNSLFGGAASAANTYDGLRVASQTNAVIAGNFIYGSDWRYLLNDESSNSGTALRDNTPSGSYGTAAVNFAGAGSTRLNNYSGVLSVSDSTERVGIGTQSPRTTAGGQSAKLHVVGRNILFGGDTDTTETDDQSKVARISVPPRDTTAGVDVTMFQYDGGAANNVLTIGGGTSANYAMSRVVINTGSGVSTTAGTERVRVDGSGNVSIGTGADAGAKLEVGGSVLLTSGSGYSIRDSGNTAQTIASYTDASGVIIGNGVTDVRILGGSTNGIVLGQSSTTANVTIPRRASADATTNLVDSNQLRIGSSYWDGASGTDAFMRLANFAVSTNGPIYYLGFSDNGGNLRLALTNNGDMTLAGQFKASGGITNTTVSGNTIAAGSGTLSLGSSSLTLSQTATLNGSASGQVLTYNGTNWAAATPSAAGIGGSTGSTDNSLLRADGTGGATLQNSAVIIDDYTSSTANNVTIAVDDGSTANITAVIKPKGSGAFKLGPKPDNTTTGGNAPGQNAVDLNLYHASASQVASGTRAITGNSGTASASDTVAIAYQGTASAANAAVIGGHAPTASGSYSFVGGGYGSVAAGQQSAFLAGQGRAEATYAVGTGESLSNKRGMFAISGGSFATMGDAQTFLITARNNTSSNTPTVLFLNGSSERITIPSNATWTFTALLTGTTASGAATYSYRFDGVIVNAAGTTSMPVAVTKTVIYETDSAADADATANNTNDALDFTVTAANSTATRWSVSVTANQITY